MAQKLIASNRKARHEYQVLDSFEAGIALQGTEVKSLRTIGTMALKDSYALIRGGEAYLLNAHIPPYPQAARDNHDPERSRKLLLHKREIEKIGQKLAEKGLTLVPLKVYFTRGIVKLELGVCRGKQKHDKRETIKKRESEREMDRAIKAARTRR